MSSKGFYCILETAFKPGDIVECVLNLDFPLECSNKIGLGVDVLCEAVISRTEETAEGYGTACDIRHYRILQPAEVRNLRVN